MSPVLATLAGASARGYGLFGAAGGTPGFESIATATLSGTSVSFNSIPQTYASLQLRLFVKDSVNNNTLLQVNSDTGSNYARHQLQGTGTSATASGLTAQTALLALVGWGDANTYGAAIIDIHDYTSTSRNKTFRFQSGTDNNGSGGVYLQSGLWLSTSAITSIQLSVAASWTGGTAALYGIKGAA